MLLQPKARLSPDCLNSKSSEERGVQEAELNGNVDSRNNHGGSSTTYALGTISPRWSQ